MDNNKYKMDNPPCSELTLAKSKSENYILSYWQEKIKASSLVLPKKNYTVVLLIIMYVVTFKLCVNVFSNKSGPLGNTEI